MCIFRQLLSVYFTNRNREKIKYREIVKDFEKKITTLNTNLISLRKEKDIIITNKEKEIEKQKTEKVNSLDRLKKEKDIEIAKVNKEKDDTVDKVKDDVKKKNKTLTEAVVTTRTLLVKLEGVEHWFKSQVNSKAQDLVTLSSNFSEKIKELEKTQIILEKVVSDEN